MYQETVKFDRWNICIVAISIKCVCVCVLCVKLAVSECVTIPA